MEWVFWYSRKMGIFLFFTLMHVSRLEKLLAVIDYVQVPAWKMTELETGGCKWYFNVAAMYCPLNCFVNFAVQEISNCKLLRSLRCLRRPRHFLSLNLLLLELPVFLALLKIITANVQQERDLYLYFYIMTWIYTALKTRCDAGTLYCFINMPKDQLSL